MLPDGPAIEERLDLVRWVAATERLTYLAILRVFDDAKSGYQVQLRPGDIGAGLVRIDGPTVDADALVRHLDMLTQWGVLERTFDASRVSSIDEYRRRRPLFQFSVLGERAYRSVRELLEATEGEGQLQRFALRQIAELLVGLDEAVRLDDGERALGSLSQIDLVLGQLADRAAQFYVMVSSMTQQVDVDATRFVELKDLLLGHLYGFLEDLHRWSPTIAERIAVLEATGVDRLLRIVASADEAVFQTYEQRLDGWTLRWQGLVSWFGRDQRSPRAAELDRRTVSGIRELTALLRRLLEAGGRGASRARDLTDLAAWFWSLDGRHAGPIPHAPAHALFAAMFGLDGARHIGAPHDDADVVAPSTPWADAPPVEVPVSLRERARLASPGQSASVPDDRRAREQLRTIAMQRLEAEQTAARRLALAPLDGRVLDRSELEVLLRLTDVALSAGVPVAGSLATGSIGAIRLEIRPSASDTVVHCVDGALLLRGVSLALVAA